MPLSELLKRGQKKATGQAQSVEAVYAESTQLSLNPFLDQKTGIVKLPELERLRGSAPAAAKPRAEPPKTAEHQISLPPGGPAAAAAPAAARVPPAAAPAGGATARPLPPAAAPAARPVSPMVAAAAEFVRPAASAPQVVVVFSCKGGAGATFLSCNLAHAYARRQVRTCLFDLDLQLGDTLAALSLQPRATIARSITINSRGEPVDAEVLPQHRSGLSVLSQVGSLEDLDNVNADGIVSLLQGLRRSFGTIFIDGIRDFSDTALAVIDAADKVTLVILQEVLAIRRGRWAFNILLKIGKEAKDIVVIVNRFVPEHNITLSTLKQMFAGATFVTVGRDDLLAQQSLDRAVPLLDLNPQHAITKHVGEIASLLLGQPAFVPPAEVIDAVGKDDGKSNLGDKLRFWKRS